MSGFEPLTGIGFALWVTVIFLNIFVHFVEKLIFSLGGKSWATWFNLNDPNHRSYIKAIPYAVAASINGKS